MRVLLLLLSSALSQTLIKYESSLPAILVGPAATTPQDCVLAIGTISDWGACSAPRCGGRGVQLQLTSLISIAPIGGGRACPLLTERSLKRLCAVDASSCTLCANGAFDDGESDIDCGGADCVRCGSGRACITSDDCATGLVCGGSETCIIEGVLNAAALVTGPLLTIVLNAADVNVGDVGADVLEGLQLLVSALAGAPPTSAFVSSFMSTQQYTVSSLRAPSVSDSTVLRISFGIIASTEEDALIFERAVNARGGELALLAADLLALSLPQIDVVERVAAAVATHNVFIAVESPSPTALTSALSTPSQSPTPSLTSTLTPTQSTSPTASPSRTQTESSTRTQSRTVSPSRTASSSVTPRSTVLYRDRAQASQDGTVLAADAAVAAGGGLTTILVTILGCAFLLAILYVRGRACCDRVRIIYGRGR